MRRTFARGRTPATRNREGSHNKVLMNENANTPNATDRREPLRSRARSGQAGIALILPVCVAAAALLALTGCQRRPTFESFGWQIVEANGAPEQVAGALYATCDEVRTWETDANGKRYDPSFAERGRTWKSEHGQETAISETRFRAKGGAEIIITRISIKGRPLLIYFNTTDTETGMDLHNKFVSNLVRNGIKPRTAWLRSK